MASSPQPRLVTRAILGPPQLFEYKYEPASSRAPNPRAALAISAATSTEPSIVAPSEHVSKRNIRPSDRAILVVNTTLWPTSLAGIRICHLSPRSTRRGPAESNSGVVAQLPQEPDEQLDP